MPDRFRNRAEFLRALTELNTMSKRLMRAGNGCPRGQINKSRLSGLSRLIIVVAWSGGLDKKRRFVRRLW
jgi:hypothetical protein